MKLSINLHSISDEYGFEKSVDVYKAAGFDAIDYSLMRMVYDDNPMNGTNYRDLALEVRRVVEEKGMTVNQTHAPFGFKAEQWDNEALFESVVLPRTARSIEISGLLGADVVVVHPIHHTPYQGHEEEVFERNMAFFRRLIPHAEKANVKIGVENMLQRDPLRKNYVADACSDPAEFVRYIDTLNSEYITACVDIGHAVLPSGSGPVADMIRALGHGRLGSLHVQDNDYKSDLHLAPYMGMLDWKEIARALGEIDYKGDFTYEVNRSILTGTGRDDGYLPIGAKHMADVGKYLCAEIDRNRPAKP
ncbi:MAG: sugar phosphate isomerase/epimerase [Clostridia bacterium]|nr:sugar phosphate isomerase/epimerase [Clostridia bacterium]